MSVMWSSLFLGVYAPFPPQRHSKICTNVHFICWFLSWLLYLKTQYWNLLHLWSASPSSNASYPLNLEIPAVSSYQTVSKSKKLLTDNQVKLCTKVKGQNALRCWISGALRHYSTSYLFCVIVMLWTIYLRIFVKMWMNESFRIVLWQTCHYYIHGKLLSPEINVKKQTRWCGFLPLYEAR